MPRTRSRGARRTIIRPVVPVANFWVCLSGHFVGWLIAAAAILSLAWSLNLLWDLVVAKDAESAMQPHSKAVYGLIMLPALLLLQDRILWLHGGGAEAVHHHPLAEWARIPDNVYWMTAGSVMAYTASCCLVITILAIRLCLMPWLFEFECEN